MKKFGAFKRLEWKKIYSMKEKKFEKGILENGGYYLGETINTNYHSHFAYIFLFSNDAIVFTEKSKYRCPVLVNKNILKKIVSKKDSKQLFIYIDPFSLYGFSLLNFFQKGTHVRKILNFDFFSKENVSLEKKINTYLELFLEREKVELEVSIDKRVIKLIFLIKEKIFTGEKLELEKFAIRLNLSESRLLHLVKQQTGITYRKIVLHYRLVLAMKYSESMNLSRGALKAV